MAWTRSQQPNAPFLKFRFLNKESNEVHSNYCKPSWSRMFTGLPPPPPLPSVPSLNKITLNCCCSSITVFTQCRMSWRMLQFINQTYNITVLNSLNKPTTLSLELNMSLLSLVSNFKSGQLFLFFKNLPPSERIVTVVWVWQHKPSRGTGVWSLLSRQSCILSQQHTAAGDLQLQLCMTDTSLPLAPLRLWALRR